MKTAIYVRVSTEEQAKEGYSISAQKDRLEKYCDVQDWDIVGIYIDDGYSAKDLNRPELQRMITDIENGHIDVVVVYRLDRLTRSVLDLYQLLERFEKNDCKFKSATETYDTTTAIGRLFITLVASLAQWERENLSERVHMGMTQKVRQGEWHGSDAPYGYHYQSGIFTINENEAKYVRRIFDLYINGLGDHKIAIRLNEQGIPTRKGKQWGENRIRYMLQNPFYIGSLRWNTKKNTDQYFTVENAVPPIIDEDTFQQAQQIRKARRKVHPKEATSNHYFSGHLKCSRCGGKLKGQSSVKKDGRKYKNYRCIHSLVGSCDQRSISEIILEKKFWEYLNQFDTKQYAKDMIPENKEEQKIKELLDEQKKIKERRKKWQYAWMNELISETEFKERMDEEQHRENEIKKELSSLDVNDNSLTDEQFVELLSDTRKNWDKLNDESKKSVVHMLVDTITIDTVQAKKRLDRVVIKEITFN